MAMPRSATFEELIQNKDDIKKEEQKDKKEIGRNHRKMKSGLVLLKNRSRKLLSNHEQNNIQKI